MAVGKNKKLGKKKAKGTKKAADAFARKEWYDIKAPSVFAKEGRQVGKTVVTKTIGTRTAKESLMHRVFNVSLGDLKKEAEDESYRKFKLKVEDVQGRHCFTNFHGMELTSDKLRSLVRKWHTLIEQSTEVKTTDGYLLRLFCIGLTRAMPNQRRKTSYAQHTQVKTIRKKMVEIMQRESQSVDLNGLVAKLISEAIGKEIERATQGIYPLQNVLIRKVKVLRSPKVDISKLIELHGGAAAAQAAAAQAAAASAEVGVKVERSEDTKDAGKGKEAGKGKDAGKAKESKDKPAKDAGKGKEAAKDAGKEKEAAKEQPKEKEAAKDAGKEKEAAPAKETKEAAKEKPAKESKEKPAKEAAKEQPKEAAKDTKPAKDAAAAKKDTKEKPAKDAKPKK